VGARDRERVPTLCEEDEIVARSSANWFEGREGQKGGDEAGSRRAQVTGFLTAENDVIVAVM
jgi:hypothetical protein